MTAQQQQPNGTTDTAQTTGATPEQLPLSIKTKGFELNQVQRNEFAALYSVTDIETGNKHGFEVFEILIQQPRTTKSGIHFAHKEVYPSAEKFGDTAKAPQTTERALELFAQYTERGRKKAEKAMSKAELANISDDTVEWMN